MSEPRFLTREQRCATAVFKQIEPLIGADESTRKKYGSLAHKLPVLIRTAGLAQALAFAQARNKPNTPQRRLVSDLEIVLKAIGVLEQAPHHEGLVARSLNAEFDEYLRLTEAALDALLWFKRFAQSELGVEAGDEPPEVPDASA